MTEFDEVVELFRHRAAACKGPHVPECDCNIYKVLSRVEEKDLGSCECFDDCDECVDIETKDQEIRQLKQTQDETLGRAKKAESDNVHLFNVKMLATSMLAALRLLKRQGVYHHSMDTMIEQGIMLDLATLDAPATSGVVPSEKPACLGISTCGGCEPACPAHE